MHCCTPRCSIITVIVGTILCIFSGLLLFFLPSIINSVVIMETELSTSSIAYDLWQHIPTKVYRQFFVFNYSNWEDFINGNAKLKAEQVGPYTYQEIRNKIFIDWENDGDHVQYRETHDFRFIPEMSPGLKENDPIWTPNLPLMSTVDTISKMTNNQTVIDEILQTLGRLIDFENKRNPDNPYKAFVKTTVGELLVYGYKDKILELAQGLVGQEFLPGSYYAMFYGINATDDGKYEIIRGYNDITQIYKISKWNESKSINLWSMDQQGGAESGCNQFNGTDGSFYWPGVKRNDKITIFISSICRSISMKYLRDMEFQGLQGYSFGSTLDLYADPNMNPDNYCFCSPNASACIAAGVTALGPCKFGAPIYLSHPHFLFTDLSTKEAVAGMNPVEEEHRSQVSIEPISGNLIRIDIRFQISLRMYKVNSISVLQDLPAEILVPLIWINESSQLDDERVDLIHDSLILPSNIFYGLMYALISLTGFLIIVGVGCAYNLMFRFRKYAATGSINPTPEYQMREETTIPRVNMNATTSNFSEYSSYNKGDEKREKGGYNY